MPVFRRSLSSEECAVIVERRREPVLIRGPGSVRTFQRWKRVIVVDLRPFALAFPPDEVISSDGVAIEAGGSVEGRAVDPVAAAVKVVDYKEATRMIAETAVRALVKERQAATFQGDLGELEAELLGTVERHVRDWGVEVSSVRLVLARDE